MRETRWKTAGFFLDRWRLTSRARPRCQQKCQHSASVRITLDPCERPIRVGSEDHPLLLAVQGEAVVKEFGALLAPVAGPVATGSAELESELHEEGGAAARQQ